ncbi:hypothetical protein N5079_31615 [Planotetraspora sp. A-T 1434]|uniref:hypothetical protein n=1 Tax=Planotetraspora sp. A-T 1434 TaxID=2979219 RepID=UPI0021C0329B|nr:hypothetical protein [Planotetraspora sp. A-T 1434]MCT9934765.1 hypothetical protein [Planotetraspora sp. A-T 1434]
MTSPPRGSRRRRPVLVPVASALGAIGLGVTALFGGLKDAPEEPPPKVAQGQVIDQGQFRTQFIKAIDTTEKDDFGGSKRYLELVLKVTNQGDKTTTVGVVPEPGHKVQRVSGFAGSILRVTPEIKTKYGPDASVLSYGIKSQQLHPGITTTVVVKYELEPTATAPNAVTVDLGSFVYDKISDRDQTYYWQVAPEGDLPTDAGSEAEAIVPAVAAQVTLPVRQERG